MVTIEATFERAGECFGVAVSVNEDFQHDVETALSLKQDEAAERGAGEILIVRDGVALPKRRSRGVAEPVDQRLTRAIAATLPAGATPVSQIGFTTALEAMADNSKAAIAADLDCYSDWCQQSGHPALPADPENQVLYIRMLERRGHKPSTLATRRCCRSATTPVSG